MIDYDRPDQLLRVFEYEPHSGVPGSSGIFVIGTGARHRVTVLSQQNRAISLINALLAAGRLRVGHRLGVVGAGVAGVTAATYAAKTGIRTTVLEASSTLLSLFSRATHRWLHPGLFNWPLPRWDAASTDLPCMNWSFSRASEVAAVLRNEFEAVRHSNDLLELIIDVGPLKLAEHEPESVSVSAHNGRLFPFDHLIVAIGFGKEESLLGSPSYWMPDDLESEFVTHQQFCLVGAGDGGLIDCLRLRLRHFDENVLVKELFGLWPTAEQRDIERKIANFEGGIRRPLNPKQITEFYCELAAPWIDDWIRSRLRHDTVVTLTDERSYPCLSTAAPLNRFLLSRLLRTDTHGLHYVSGKFLVSSDKRLWSLESGDQQWSSNETAWRVIARMGSTDVLTAFSPLLDKWSRTKASVYSELDFFERYWGFTHVEASIPLANVLPDEASQILTTSDKFRELLTRHSDAFFARVWNELRGTDLSTAEPHRDLFCALRDDNIVRRQLGGRELSQATTLSDAILRQGVLPPALRRIPREREISVAVAPVCIGTAACFFYMRNVMRLPLRLRFDAAQAVNFLERIRNGSESKPPDLIAGQDALAVDAICLSTNPAYFPLAASLSIQHCILGTVGSDLDTPALCGLIAVPNESPNALDRKFTLVLRPSLSAAWETRTVDVTRHIALAMSGANEPDLHLYSFGIVGDVAEWLGFGRVKPISRMIDDVGTAALASSSLGTIVVREDLASDEQRKNAWLIAFLQAYRELSSDDGTARRVVSAMLGDEDFTACLAATMGYAAILREARSY